MMNRRNLIGAAGAMITGLFTKASAAPVHQCRGIIVEGRVEINGKFYGLAVPLGQLDQMTESEIDALPRVQLSLYQMEFAASNLDTLIRANKAALQGIVDDGPAKA